MVATAGSAVKVFYPLGGFDLAAVGRGTLRAGGDVAGGWGGNPPWERSKRAPRAGLTNLFLTYQSKSGFRTYTNIYLYFAAAQQGNVEVV